MDTKVKKLLDKHKKKWCQIGLSTDSTDEAAACAAIAEACKANDIPEPGNIVFLDSPYEGVLAAALMQDVLGGKTNLTTEKIRDHLADKKTHLAARVAAGAHIDHACHGSMSAPWLGYYAFYREYKPDSKEAIEPLHGLMDLAQAAGWFFPFKEVWIVTARPKTISKNDKLQLHCDGAPALGFRDDWGAYCLNGVLMPREVVMTPASRLDAKLITKTTNVEVRKEIVTKIGIERAISQLNATVLDERGTYKLLRLALDDEGRIHAHILQMENPSVEGVHHLESVGTECHTVQDALNFRRYGELSESNPDWNPSASHLS